MAIAPEEITFEEAAGTQAPAAPEEISFEEAQGVDPEAIQRGIELGVGATRTVQGVLQNPLVGMASEGARAEAMKQRLAALPIAVTAPAQATQALIGAIQNPLVGQASQAARQIAQRQRERQLIQQMGRASLDPAAMAGVLPEEEAQATKDILTKPVEFGFQKAHEALAPALSDFLVKSGLDPSSTPDRIINLPRLTADQIKAAGEAGRGSTSLFGQATSAVLRTAPSVVAGLGNLQNSTVESFAQPEQAALLLATGGESAVARVASLIFSAQQFVSLPDQIREAVKVLQDPNASNADKVEAMGKPGIGALFGVLMAKHGFASPQEASAFRAASQPRPDLTARTEVQPPPIPKAPEAAPALGPIDQFDRMLQDPNASVKNEHSLAAGLAVKNLDDLKKLFSILKRERQADLDRVAEAERTGNKTLLGKSQGQFPREAIETATKSGSWDKDLPEIGLGARPLDWTKNPEVQKWLKENSREIWPTDATQSNLPPELRAAPKASEPETKPTEGETKPAELETPAPTPAPAPTAPETSTEFVAKLDGFSPAERLNIQRTIDADPNRPELAKWKANWLKTNEVRKAAKATQPELPIQPAAPKMNADQVRDLVAKAATIVRTRKLSPVERKNLAIEMENARLGNPEKLQAMVDSLTRAEPKVAPKQKGGPLGRFRAETEAHGDDILSWIESNMKLLSKSGAKKSGRFAKNSSEWADAPSELSATHHGVIYSEAGSLPSEVADRAFKEGKLSAPSASALWEKISADSKKRAGAVEGAAKRAKLEAEAGPQFERWNAATSAPRPDHQVELTTEELGVGDTFKVDGETVKVSLNDHGDLTLIDGDRFGTQTLAEGEKIYVAEHTPKPTTERPGDVFSKVNEHPGGEAGAAIEAHGTPSGLPPGVPDGGKDFPSELMAAAQKLGTIIRTKLNMGPGVLGRYVRSRAGVTMEDKIEVGELDNQSTVAHEMGHDLDQLLWPAVDLAYPMKSLADREGIPGTGKELHTELTAVSELMRGPIKGSKAYVNYRRRAAELIADHFALYAHDPARARAMAPKWTKVLEDALARNPHAQETIAQLHAGNVIPVAGIPATPQPPTGPAAGMPGRVPPVIPQARLSPDAGLFNAAAGAVKGLWRKFKSEVIRAQIIADAWFKLVPKQMDRFDVGAAVEGIGNLEIPGDTIADVMARMTPAKQKMLKLYKYAIENVRGKVNQYLKGMTDGEYLDFLQDYLPHFYDVKSSQGQQALGRFIKNSPNAKQRKIPTLQEAVAFGLKPITQDPAVLYQLHSRINWRVATNRMLIGQLDQMKTAGGAPVLVPWSQQPGGYVRSDNPLIQRVYAMKNKKGDTMLWRGGAGIHPDAWTAVQQMLDMPTSSGLMAAYDMLNGFTRANAFAFSLFHDVTLRAAAAGAGSMRLGIPRTVGEIPQKLNLFRGLFRVMEKNPITGELEMFRSTRSLGKEMQQNEAIAVDAARHGLVFSWNDSESYQMAAREFLDVMAARHKGGVIGTAARMARDVQHWRQEGLWKNTHDAYKIISYHDLVSQALDSLMKSKKGTPISEAETSAVKERVASLLNDAYGGQEWQTKFWLSPANRRVMSRFLLAPDWTLSTIRSVPLASDVASIVRANAPRIAGREPIPTMREGLGGNLDRARFWRGEVAAIAAATIAAQYAIYNAFGNKEKGDKAWVWENEDGQRRRVDATPIIRHMPWKDPNDPTRYYVNLGKRPEEILGYVTHFEQNLMSKASRPVVEVMRQLTGTEGDFKAQWKRDHETFIESIPERSLKAAGQFVPFVFSGNQFAFSLPYRKGMTKYKAQEAYETVYELAADPGMFPAARAFLRGVQSPDGTLTEMVDKITDAADRNGVPSEEIRKRALSTIRGKYYDKYFKASKKLDEGPSRSAERDLEKAAQALENLGATGHQIFESTKRRTALEPYSP